MSQGSIASKYMLNPKITSMTQWYNKTWECQNGQKNIVESGVSSFAGVKVFKLLVGNNIATGVLVGGFGSFRFPEVNTTGLTLGDLSSPGIGVSTAQRGLEGQIQFSVTGKLDIVFSSAFSAYTIVQLIVSDLKGAFLK